MKLPKFVDNFKIYKTHHHMIIKTRIKMDDSFPKMDSKTFRFCIILTILVPLTYTFIIGTLVLRSGTFPLIKFPTEPHRPECPEDDDRQLRIYMYDLPGKFNVEMLEKYYWSSEESSLYVTGRLKQLPRWPNWGAVAHYGMEYWLMASLLHGGGHGGKRSKEEMEVVGVLDPEMADVFFVPFFASLSFHTPEFNDKELQVELVEILQASKYWQRSKGRDHIIPLTLPNAFQYLRLQLNASLHIVVDFGSNPKNLSNLHKDVLSPYTHLVDTFVDDNSPNPYESRPTLLHFRGDISPTNGGDLRGRLANMLGGIKDVIFESSNFRVAKNIKVASQEMRSSKFCLVPPGNIASSARLFDIIVSHCVPVIISDNIELPFEDQLDYSEFSIFFSLEEALRVSKMVKKLREFPKDRWVDLWGRIKNISHHFEFQYPPKKEDGVNMLWRQVKHKLPAIRLAIHRSRRLRIPDWWED